MEFLDLFPSLHDLAFENLRNFGNFRNLGNFFEFQEFWQFGEFWEFREVREFRELLRIWVATMTKKQFQNILKQF